MIPCICVKIYVVLILSNLTKTISKKEYT